MPISSLTLDEERANDTFDMAIATSELEDSFATQPEMPAYRQPNEEELHTSFEAAISNRVCILHRQLALKSGPLTQTGVQHQQPNTDVLQHSHSFVNKTSLYTQAQSERAFSSALFSNAWQRLVVFACAAVMFMLLGFDMMGLLVLHTH